MTTLSKTTTTSIQNNSLFQAALLAVVQAVENWDTASGEKTALYQAGEDALMATETALGAVVDAYVAARVAEALAAETGTLAEKGTTVR